MKLIEKHKSLVATIAMAAASVAFVILVFLPGQTKTQAFRDQLRNKRASIAGATLLKASAARLESELQRARAFTQEWKERAPDEARMPQTFGLIYESAQQSGATISKFEPQNATTMHTIRRVPLLLTSRGTFAQISKILFSIEQLPMTIWFDSLRFTPSRENAQRIECEAKLVVFADKTGNSD